MLNNRLARAMLLVVSAAVVFGCAQPLPQRQVAQRLDSMVMNEVVFIDHELNRIELDRRGYVKEEVIKVSLQAQGGRRTETDTLESYAVLKNHTDYDLQLQGRTLFFDYDDIPLDDVTNWKRVYIPANGFATYRDSSISADAESYIVEIREGR